MYKYFDWLERDKCTRCPRSFPSFWERNVSCKNMMSRLHFYSQTEKATHHRATYYPRVVMQPNRKQDRMFYAHVCWMADCATPDWIHLRVRAFWKGVEIWAFLVLNIQIIYNAYVTCYEIRALIPIGNRPRVTFPRTPFYKENGYYCQLEWAPLWAPFSRDRSHVQVIWKYRTTLAVWPESFCQFFCFTTWNNNVRRFFRKKIRKYTTYTELVCSYDMPKIFIYKNSRILLPQYLEFTSSGICYFKYIWTCSYFFP